MPDYKVHDPRGWCGDPKRGAALGRRSYQDEDADWEGKLSLRRVYLSGDYDSNGTYWGGGGEPLYWVANEELTIDYVIRARDRKAAKEMVRSDYPKARFYN